LGLKLREDAGEVRPLAVEHVDDQAAGDAELFRAFPDPAGLHLDSHHAANDQHNALDNSQCRQQITLEAGVAGRVDQVQLVTPPEHVADSGLQRELVFALLVVPVRDGRARLHRSESSRGARLEEERLD
jgi:hypothetical protein